MIQDTQRPPRPKTPEELKYEGEMGEALRRFGWGFLGVAAAFAIWFAFALAVEQRGPKWLEEGAGMGLVLGAYWGMSEWRGRRERLASGARRFAWIFAAVLALFAVVGLFRG